MWRAMRSLLSGDSKPVPCKTGVLGCTKNLLCNEEVHGTSDGVRAQVMRVSLDDTYPLKNLNHRGQSTIHVESGHICFIVTDGHDYGVHVRRASYLTTPSLRSEGEGQEVNPATYKALCSAFALKTNSCTGTLDNAGISDCDKLYNPCDDHCHIGTSDAFEAVVLGPGDRVTQLDLSVHRTYGTVGDHPAQLLFVNLQPTIGDLPCNGGCM